jgi:hypothetical protein
MLYKLIRKVYERDKRFVGVVSVCSRVYSRLGAVVNIGNNKGVVISGDNTRRAERTKVQSATRGFNYLITID